MVRHSAPFIVSLVVVLCAVPATPLEAAVQDEEPLVTDRPDFTESARSVAPGRFQFELGYTYTEVGDAEEHSIGELLARIGILSWLEGRIGLNSIVLARSPGVVEDGLQDITLGAKAELFVPEAGTSGAVPRVALLVGSDIPTGDEKAGEDEWQPGVTAAAGWGLTDRLSLGANLGWARIGSGDERFDQGLASVALGLGLGPSTSIYGEWYALFPERRDGGSNHFLDGGIAWLLSADVQLDARLGLGLQDPDPNWFVGAGLSFRL